MPDLIVVAATLPGEPYRRWDGVRPYVLPAQGPVMDAAEIRSHLADAVALVPLLTQPVRSDVLEAAPHLRIVANVAVGYDNVDVAAATARGIVVTNTPDVLTDATADLTWALILGAARNLPWNDRYLREGRFTGWLPGALLGADVTGRTLGIVGLGRIGRAVARRAAGFEMRVLGHDPGAADGPPGVQAVDLDTLLAESDFVTLHCPLRPETHHLIDATRLRRMKRTAYLINTSRGPVVDEAALAEALRDGVIAGAGLDVYEREPAVEAALLPLADRVVLLPHVGSATVATRQAMARLAVDAVDELLAGRRPRHVVNPAALEVTP
jgi:glyoxylate reductase